MAHHGHRLLAERHDGEPAGRRRIGHDPDIRVVADDRLDHLVRVDELELDPRLRIERHEALLVATQIVQSDRVNGRDPHRTVDPRLHGSDLGPGFLPAVEERPARGVKGIALGRDHEGALGPIEQRHAELLLELLNGLARRGL